MNSRYACFLLVLISFEPPTSSGRTVFEKLKKNPQISRSISHIQNEEKIELGNKENNSVIDSQPKNSSENQILCPGRNKVLVSGKCYLLLKTGPCEKGEWLVMDNSTQEGENSKAVCKAKPCPENEIWWPTLSKCFTKNQAKLSFCNGTAKIILVNVFGEGICTCFESFAKMEDDKCYEYYQRGPCQHNEVVTFNPKTGSGICSVDKCFQENEESTKKSDTEKDLVQQNETDKSEMVKNVKEKPYAPLHGDGPCHRLGLASICGEFGEQSRYVVDQISHVPKCSSGNSQLNFIKPPLICNLNPSGDCAKSVVIQKNH